jgi:galactokinase
MSPGNSTKVNDRYKELYGGSSRLFRAPGRVNLIGEHTDYNQGFVLPCAINLETQVAAGAGGGARISAYSEQFSEKQEFDLESGFEPPRSNWTDYIRGVALSLQQAGHTIRGTNLVIDSGIPIGSGLSSSAALEVASAIAMLTLSGICLPPREIAALCQQAENEYVGARCGIMDQFASLLGKEGHAILLDCRSLESEYLPLPYTVRLVVTNSMVQHALASGEYNRRRLQCEDGVRILSTFFPTIQSLRDVELNDLRSVRGQLDDVIYRRCLHVIEENQRVLRAGEALKSVDLSKLGELMRASHESLRDNYEVSSPELDLLVRLASRVAGVFGSRMMGGGFGGSTISLVDSTRVNAFRESVSEGYFRETGKRPEVYICSAANGAGDMSGV